MAETGERYTDALQAVAPPEAGTTDYLSGLVADLGVPHRNVEAFEQLKALSPDDLRVLAIAGLESADPQVRRRCCGSSMICFSPTSRW